MPAHNPWITGGHFEVVPQYTFSKNLNENPTPEEFLGKTSKSLFVIKTSIYTLIFFRGKSVGFRGTPWNSMEFHMEFDLEFRNSIWNSMEFNGIPWNSMEFHVDGGGAAGTASAAAQRRRSL